MLAGGKIRGGLIPLGNLVSRPLSFLIILPLHSSRDAFCLFFFVFFYFYFLFYFYFSFFGNTFGRSLRLVYPLCDAHFLPSPPRAGKRGLLKEKTPILKARELHRLENKSPGK